MTIYQATKPTGELILEGSILAMRQVLPAGSRTLSVSEKKSARIKLGDAWRTMDGKIIIIKIKETNGLRNVE